MWRAAAGRGAEREWGEGEGGKEAEEEEGGTNEQADAHGGEYQEEESGGSGVMLVNDMLQWSVAEEDTLYALRGWQIEQLDDLRWRSQRRQSDAQPTLITKRKTRPSLNNKSLEEHWASLHELSNEF
jgi:hypothetical protein